MSTSCSVDDCGKVVFARGWCQGHYTRWLKYGDVQSGLKLTSKIRGDAEARFFQKVVKTGPVPAQRPELGACWLWRGASMTGYGRLKIDNEYRLAHRLSYEWFCGPIGEGLTIDHLCRVTLCVNPAHLEAVSAGENTRRAAQARTACKNGHEYTEDNVRTWSRGKRVARVCRKCRTERAQRNRDLLLEAIAREGKD